MRRLLLPNLLALIALSHSFAHATPPISTDALPTAFHAGLGLIGTGPENYPQTKGAGFGIGYFLAPFKSWKHGLDFNGYSQGEGYFITAEYRHYVSGGAQFSPSPRGMETNFKQQGWFIQGGITGYSLLQTDLTTKDTFRISGLGVVIGTGWEKPIWGKYFLSPRVTYVNSVWGGSSFYGFNVRLLVGIPITFY